MIRGVLDTSPGSLTSNGVALSARSSGCKSRLGHNRGWTRVQIPSDKWSTRHRSSVVEQPREPE